LYFVFAEGAYHHTHERFFDNHVREHDSNHTPERFFDDHVREHDSKPALITLGYIVVKSKNKIHFFKSNYLAMHRLVFGLEHLPLGVGAVAEHSHQSLLISPCNRKESQTVRWQRVHSCDCSLCCVSTLAWWSSH